MARGLAQPHIARDDRIKNSPFKMVSNLLSHLLGKAVSTIIHGQQNPCQFKVWIKASFYRLESLQKLG